MTAILNTSPSLNAMQLTNDDLDACLDVVESYWTQIREYTSRPKLTSDDLETLFHYFEQLVEIVSLDLANDQGRTRLLQCLERKEIFNQYFAWLLQLTDSNGRLKEHLLASVYPLARPIAVLSAVLPDLHLCQFLVSAIDYVICVNKQQQMRTVPQEPINLLLGQIALGISKAIAANQDLFLAVYSNRCAFLPAYRDFLGQHYKEKVDEQRFPIITAMLSVALVAGESGDLGREAIVLLVDAVRQHERTDIAVFLAENTDLCPVLATGLSGLFSTLPRTLLPDANSILFTSQNFDAFFAKPEPVLFVECFRFVNRVVTLSHPAIRDRLVDFLYHGFLVPVLAPALNQPVGDELITTIVYLDYLCLQNLSDPHVADAFVKFLLNANYDGMSTIDTLVKYLDLPSNTKSPSKSGSSHHSTSSYWRLLFCTLGMFHSFLSLRPLSCSENVFYELIHRHLASLTYLMRSQRLQLVSATKARLKSMCILCSLPPPPPPPPAQQSNSQFDFNGTNEKSQFDALPNAFYKRGADHYLSLVTLDTTPNKENGENSSSDSSPNSTPSVPVKKHLYSVSIIRSLEETPVGRQLLSEYTALLEETPRRLSLVDKQTQQWRKCGTLNSLTLGLCANHRQLVMEQRDEEKFFDAEIWSDLCTSNNDSDDTLQFDEAEKELNDLIEALDENNGDSSNDSGTVDDALEKLDLADLSGLIPASQSELPFTMNVAAIGHQQRPHADSFNQSASTSTQITVGPFLTRIFELVDHFTELPTPVVVALGTLLSQLSSIPHPLLAPLLLDPQLNVHPNVKSLPLVLSAVRERFLEKIATEGYTASDLKEALYAQCQQLTTGDFHFADQMRHWSPSTSPLPADENHFSSPKSPPSASRHSAIKAAANEPPNSPRSFFSRLLLSSNSNGSSNKKRTSITSRLVTPQRKNSLNDNENSSPDKRQSGEINSNGVATITTANEIGVSTISNTISASSSSEFELVTRGGMSKSNSSGSCHDHLSTLARSLVLFDATLLELAAISTSASRRFL